jgi:hypothetical protein
LVNEGLEVIGPGGDGDGAVVEPGRARLPGAIHPFHTTGGQAPPRPGRFVENTHGVPGRCQRTGARGSGNSGSNDRDGSNMIEFHDEIIR